MRNLRLCLVFFLFISALVGCSTASPTPTSVPPTTVRVQLDWIHTVEYSGLYLAEANGYFAEENLAVEFVPNDGSFSSVDALYDNDMDFVLTGADTLLRAREAGRDLVAIATIYQRLPLAFMSLAAEQIATPADMAGKRVMLSMGRTSEFAFRAMMQVAGVDLSTVTIVPRNVFNESPLLNNDVDVIDVFVTNQVVQMNRAGIQVNLILPVDYGVEMYVNTIATRQSLIDENPELVAAFTRALVRGLQASIDDTEAATTATLALNADLEHDSELESMNTSLPFINPSTSHPGMMSPSTWEFIYNMLTEQGILTQAQDVSAAYNLQFLEAIYGSS
jgi:NitT/TauT family transport system substrate-binding protein